MRKIMTTVLAVSSLVIPGATWAQSENVEVDEYTDNMYSDIEENMIDEDALAEEQGFSSDDAQLAGQAAPETTQVSEREAGEPEKRGLGTERFGTKIHLGAVNYDNLSGGSESRWMAGLLFEWNWASTFNPNRSRWYFGPVTGAMYSFTGGPDASFWGSGDGNGNLLIIPTDLKIGYAFSDYFRFAVHGGGNVIYRSRASTISLGSNPLEVSGDEWDYFPNIGGDIEIGLGKSVALMLRPDLTFTSGDDIFTGTIALAFPMG